MKWDLRLLEGHLLLGSVKVAISVMRRFDTAPLACHKTDKHGRADLAGVT